ncbi:MAG TPA: MBL fold metallo-hydrolase [Saprospiraceae bacterium]|nr:MBL fold metallo-hydrolase [Saprospiraceae bacterium]
MKSVRSGTSPNFKEGRFQNLSHTPQLTEGYTFLRVIKENLLSSWPDKIPAHVLPSIKTNLFDLPKDEDVLVWFGHSSYFIQVNGKRFLIDPVFSGHASPFPGMINAFKGSDIYTVDDLPNIDYLFITHDHYDHLDCKTIVKLRSKVSTVICGLGVGAHLIKWGYSVSSIIEKDWYDTFSLNNQFTVHTLPARHFSGRGFVRNNTLWCSYLLETSTMKIYIGGDSGYDTHFTEIGNKFEGIDLAILENGQYNNAWRYIHMHPNEVLQAAQDLKAKRIFPVHSGKFSLSTHAWYEPLTRISELNKETNIPLVTPLIGEKVSLKDVNQSFKPWWVISRMA